MKKLQTYDRITSLVNHVIKKISQGKEIDLDEETLQEANMKQLQKVLEGQETIGWMGMMKGYTHIGWANAQQRHYRRMGLNNKFYNNAMWKRMFLIILTDYGKDCWKC